MRGLRKFAALFVFLLSVGPLWLASPAAAETTAGLTVEVYTYDSQSTPERQPYQLCEGAWTSVPNIDADYDNQYNGVVAGCQPEFVLVHYTGYITFPESGTYAFMAPADDGFWMSFDGTPIITNDWVLKGRWGQVYPDVQIEGGRSYALDAWFYEYGGGASATLMYSPDNGLTWITAPSEFFTTEPTVPVITPFLNAPVNVQTSVVENSVKVTWDAPEDSGTAVERYAVTWTYDDYPGWGVGVVGNEFTITGLPENKEIKIWVRSDNDSLAVYSKPSETVFATTLTIYVPPVDPPIDPPVDPPVDPVDPPVEPPVEPVEPPVVEPEPELPPEVPAELPKPEPKPEPQPEEGSAEIPEVIENLMDVNLAAVDPTELTEAQAEQLVEAAFAAFETAEAGSAEYEQALDALYLAAQQDDIVVDEALAAIPLLGNLAVGLTDAFNFAGNIGADMSPKVRELAEKQVLVSVVAVGAAVQAAAGAATSAAAAAASSTSSRKN